MFELNLLVGIRRVSFSNHVFIVPALDQSNFKSSNCSHQLDDQSCSSPCPLLPHPSSSSSKHVLRPFCSQILYNGRHASPIWILAACKTDPCLHLRLHPVCMTAFQGSRSVAKTSYLHLFTCATFCTFGFSACQCFGAAPCPYSDTYALSLTHACTHTYTHRGNSIWQLWVVSLLPLWQNETDG